MTPLEQELLAALETQSRQYAQELERLDALAARLGDLCEMQSREYESIRQENAELRTTMLSVLDSVASLNDSLKPRR